MKPCPTSPEETSIQSEYVLDNLKKYGAPGPVGIEKVNAACLTCDWLA
jgi:hypothetical protein